ncbi:MAG: hypothetical protein U1A27_04175 [Phycisphaerae bacterium]
MAHHLVIVHDTYLRAMLAGHKRVECRLSRLRRPAFAQAAPGDRFWFKVPAGPVRAAATIVRRRLLSVSGPQALQRIARQYGPALCAPDSFWRMNDRIRWVGLFWIDQVEAIEPFHVVKRDGRAWVSLAGAPQPGQRLPALRRERAAPSGPERTSGRRLRGYGERRASRSRPRSSPTKLKN